MRSYLYLNTNTSSGTSVSSNPDQAGYQWSNADIQMLLDEVYTRELSILLPQVGIRTDEFYYSSSMILLGYISPNNFHWNPFLLFSIHLFIPLS